MMNYLKMMQIVKYLDQYLDVLFGIFEGKVDVEETDSFYIIYMYMYIV